MNVAKNNIKTFNLLKKNERNVNVFKFKNNFYLKHKELVKACENQTNKESIILKSYLFKKEKAYLNEKDIGKILNKVIKKKIKNEYIWDNIQNLLFKFHLKHIEEKNNNNNNEINGHNKNVIPTNNNQPSFFYYNQKFDHINVYLLSIAIKTLNKRNTCIFNFFFSYLQHFYSSIEPRHFIHIFHVLVKNTYRNLINKSKENINNLKYDKCTHLRNENYTNNYMNTIREIYRDKIICSEKNLIELLTKYCIVNINYFSYNDIGLICESLCYFSIKNNPFSEYWNDFLFYIFDLNIKGKSENGEIHIIDSSTQCKKLCTSNIFLKNYEHSELFLEKKKLASNFYMDDKYIELNGKNVLSILKYVYNYHNIFPDIIYIGTKLKHILLKNNLDITLHEYSEILYYLNCLNELDLTFLKEKTSFYQNELESELLNTYDIECLLKISQIYFSYFVDIPFLAIFLNNVHKISTENSLVLLKLILKYYESNVYYHKISAQKIELKNTLSSNIMYDNISSYYHKNINTYFMDHISLNNAHFYYSFHENIQNEYNDVINNYYKINKIKFIEEKNSFRDNSIINNSYENQNCTQNLINPNTYSNKNKQYLHNKLTNKLLKGGRKKRKICKNQDDFYSDNNLVRSLFLSLYSTCSEIINTFSHKEIFFLCDILNKENFVHYGVIKGISNKVSEDLNKWKLDNSYESKSYIEKYYADYLVFVASFIYNHNNEGENIINFLLDIFLNNNDKKNFVQSRLYYYYAFYLLNLKIANKKTASIEHLNLLIKNVTLFNYSDLYNNILIYFFKSCKNNYKYIIKNKKFNFNEKKKKIQKKNAQPSSKDVVINNFLNNIYYSNVYIFNIKSFNIELLKIFLYLWNTNQTRPGRRCLDFIVTLNKFYDDISVRTYICSYNIINMLSRYVHLLHIKKMASKKKMATNYIFYLNDQIKGAILRFNLENAFSLFNKEKKEKKGKNNCLEKNVFLQNNYSDQIEKIKNSENYILNDYKHKKNIVTKKEIKNAKPAKYFKNCKKGQPVDHFLSMYVNEYLKPQ
ncbi:conserved Plasmodium protein, unknown function [Plasmodium yoelii]|uniref:Uncharacterized protein n=2 Tax=Plasmodium yoelii TaxID=5861 RepID=A0AAF0B2R1_PLAYO|nr:conserved Plasmodium protein, unknown function [Plasmodium yoelii]WBY56041.1 hypothetical protein Py17XNL_000600720 [Plasmodium yoelii yoelii]CDU17022.1 conserved Plasmodium protein, unknown function [Plasmodium yoelii]VTZ75418.1 conserved Plasmodium protein, unknown function [Plasmodium yoelii]|eukprot:XP_725556.2 conserved Plasmodium protein, unknown function [Plasmodium yoelii]